MLFGARDHTASPWLDLAEGRLRLDRLSRNGAGSTFFPWLSTHGDPVGTPVRPFLARQESLTAAILRCAPARAHPIAPARWGPRAAGASSIASGLPIAIEAAVVAGSKQPKEK